MDDEDQQSHFKHGELEMTTDTFGLFLAKSCTHNKPTCMHLKISISKHGLDIIGSIKTTILSIFHNFHAWKQENRTKIHTINTKMHKKQK